MFPDIYLNLWLNHDYVQNIINYNNNNFVNCSGTEMQRLLYIQMLQGVVWMVQWFNGLMDGCCEV